MSVCEEDLKLWKEAKEKEGRKKKEGKRRNETEVEKGKNRSPKGNMWSAIPVALL